MELEEEGRVDAGVEERGGDSQRQRFQKELFERISQLSYALLSPRLSGPSGSRCLQTTASTSFILHEIESLSDYY